MLKLAKSKKGVSLTEIIAAIIIIGLASTTITSMVITSYKGQLRAQQYVLAEEIAKTYDSMLARDIKKAKISAMSMDEFKNTGENASNKFKEIDSELLAKMTGDDAPVYISLYSNTKTQHFQLNNNYYDSTNVKLEIYMIANSTTFCYFKTRITVSYSNDRQVTYNGTHYKDQA